jgi:hypothetical protein
VAGKKQKATGTMEKAIHIHNSGFKILRPPPHNRTTQSGQRMEQGEALDKLRWPSYNSFALDGRRQQRTPPGLRMCGCLRGIGREKSLRSEMH